MRYFIEIAYDGTQYHGWQEQKNATSVQQLMGDALSTLLGQSVDLVGSGRTDTGVHAFGQVAHFDIESEIVPDKLKFRLNRFLPSDISIHQIYPVSPEAHARFSAVARTYEYRISVVKDPFLAGKVYFRNTMPDIRLMNEAAGILLQEQDFQAFSRVKTDVNHFRCRITRAVWKKEGNMARFIVRSDRFLRGMVRAIVGTLLEVDKHRLTTEGFKQIIKKKDRRLSGPAVPPYGLYLSRVEYPDNIRLKR